MSLVLGELEVCWNSGSQDPWWCGVVLSGKPLTLAVSVY